MTTLGLSYLNYAEQKRSNLAKEAEAHRANIENEDRARSALLEEIRSHQRNEELNLRNIQETEKSHRVSEAQKSEEIGIKSQEVGLKSEDLQALIDYRNRSLNLSRDTLVTNAWNNFAESLRKSKIPFASNIAAGASLSALKTVEERSIVDTAIGDIISEVAAATSPADSKEREEVSQTLANIDSQIREFAYKSLGSLFNIADFASEFVADYSSAAQFGSAVKKAFSDAAQSARNLAGGVESIQEGVTSKFKEWGEKAQKWATSAFVESVNAARRLGTSIGEWFADNAANLVSEFKKEVLGVGGSIDHS